MSTSFTVGDGQALAIEKEFTLLRALIVSPVALFTTGFLIWGMDRLIHTDGIPVDDRPPYEIPNPILKIEEPPAVIRDTIIKPQEAAPEPEPPRIERFVGEPGDTGFDLGPRDKPLPGGNGLNFSADVPIATMLTQPEYPNSAIAKGIEGYVDVRFDVAPTGATDNIEVVGYMPSKIFNSAAIRAVKRWKFQPAEKSGKPVLYRGLEQRITFQMGN